MVDEHGDEFIVIDPAEEPPSRPVQREELRYAASILIGAVDADDDPTRGRLFLRAAAELIELSNGLPA